MRSILRILTLLSLAVLPAFGAGKKTVVSFVGGATRSLPFHASPNVGGDYGFRGGVGYLGSIPAGELVLPSMAEVVSGAALSAAWLGHATVLMRIGGAWVLTDPVRGHPAWLPLVVGTVALMWGTRLSPLWPIAAGAALGAMGWV